jgi:hypothetical protein
MPLHWGCNKHEFRHVWNSSVHDALCRWGYQMNGTLASNAELSHHARGATLKTAGATRGSMVGINAMNHTIIKITTAVVDHGREAATRSGSKSTQKSQNGDRVADKKSEDTRARFCVDLSGVSSMFIELPLMSLARSFGPSPLAQQHNPAAQKDRVATDAYTEETVKQNKNEATQHKSRHSVLPRQRDYQTSY